MNKLVIFAFIISLFLLFTSQVKATTSDLLWNSLGNSIYNANSGGVGIGTSQPLLQLQVNGQSGFGNNITQNYPFINAQFDQANSGNDSWRGIRSYLSQTAGGNTNPIIAIDGACYYTASSGKLTDCRGGDFTGVSTSTGSLGALRGINTNIEMDNSGNVTDAILGSFGNFAFTNSGATPVISNAYGIFAGVRKAGAGAANAQITNGYGLYVDTVQAKNSYGIYQSDQTNNNFLSGNLGLGISLPSQKLEVNGGIRFNTTDPRPNCTNLTDGLLWFTQGGVGVKDSLQICAKGIGGTMAWRNLW